MPMLKLAIKSLWNRRFTAMLTLISIALSVALLLGVERVRTEARSSFANTISGADLIVGARGGPIPLLLYSVFRIGDATNNISWKSYLDIIKDPHVDWSIPISLGDSHKGFRVLGTTPAYFQHYHYGHKQSLVFTQGVPFSGVYDAVLGADVEAKLHYKLGRKIILAHGAGGISLFKHSNKPFTVVGVLAKTGTPVDRTVHVSLAGIEAIHIDWHNGNRPLPGMGMSAREALKQDLTPKTITAFLLGLKSRISAFTVQRHINNYPQEPLLAILPGVALQQLWDMMGVAEKALLAISLLVVLVGLTGMATVILTSLNERRREMAILRSVGARPLHIFILIMGEAISLTLIGTLLGLILLYALLWVGQPIIETQFGLFINIDWPTNYEFTLLGILFAASLLVSFIPAYRAYRYSLSDGMTIRI